VRRSAALFAAVLTTAAVFPGAALAASRDATRGRCVDRDPNALPLTVDVGGQPATGWFALPDRPPTGLVLFDHGYGHDASDWRVHLADAARDLGVVAVAMDYRGPAATEPLGSGWHVREGAEDTIAATRLFQARCRTIGKTVVLGVSMGGNTSGLAVEAGARRTDGSPLFDYWIDVEGATNVIETYQSARLLAPANAFAAGAVRDIEREAGGSLEERPEAYRDLDVVARAPQDLPGAGLRGVVVVHSVGDGLVPYDQSREMAAELRAMGIPTDFYTVGRRGSDENDTTITGYGGYHGDLAGHANEESKTHPVMVTALDRLRAVLAGETPQGYEEHTVNVP
jgi:acetyl esterase/lipase